MTKILLVDDDPVIRKLLSGILEHEGYEVAMAPDGMEAMVQIRKDRPHVVILDVIMPEVNGYDVCRSIKFDPQLKNIPIILLTSRDEEIDKPILKLMGIDYLHKTCKPQELLEKIKNLMDRVHRN